MREQTCCFSGHRVIATGERARLAVELSARISALIAAGVTRFVCGGALGFDTLAAEAVLAAREAHPAVRLILVLPCRTQADRWPADNRQRYREILARADEHSYVADEYVGGCMQARNRRMVDLSGHIICYLSSMSGGTYYTVRYALRHNLQIINLACNPGARG